MEKLIRIHQLAIKTRNNDRHSVRHPLFACLAEFCADLYNRFQIDISDLWVARSNQAKVEYGGDVQSVCQSAITMPLEEPSLVQSCGLIALLFHHYFCALLFARRTLASRSRCC